MLKAGSHEPMLIDTDEISMVTVQTQQSAGNLEVHHNRTMVCPIRAEIVLKGRPMPVYACVGDSSEVERLVKPSMELVACSEPMPPIDPASVTFTRVPA
jgi:hypothetical protein